MTAHDDVNQFIFKLMEADGTLSFKFSNACWHFQIQISSLNMNMHDESSMIMNMQSEKYEYVCMLKTLQGPMSGPPRLVSHVREQPRGWRHHDFWQRETLSQ